MLCYKFLWNWSVTWHSESWRLRRINLVYSKYQFFSLLSFQTDTYTVLYVLLFLGSDYCGHSLMTLTQVTFIHLLSLACEHICLFSFLFVVLSSFSATRPLSLFMYTACIVNFQVKAKGTSLIADKEKKHITILEGSLLCTVFSTFKINLTILKLLILKRLWQS